MYGKPWFLRGITKYFSYIHNMTLQHIGLHMSVAPNGVEQVVLSDQFARTFGKTLQNSEGFWSKRYPFLSTQRIFMP